jgi:hypothetical protein
MNSLPAAVKLFLDRNLTLAQIDVPKWADTYNVTTAEFMAEVERQQSERSLAPTNTFEEPEGK